ncbi:MAG: ATP-binding protein [Polyangiaceae bacterium]|jgi:PAS domain S-box-containing protein
MIAPDQDDAAERELALSRSLLQVTLDATTDGLLLLDRRGRVLHFNRRFQELWRIPDEVSTVSHNEELIAFVSRQLLDPDGFQARARALYTNPEVESFDVLRFRDGRVFERHGRPHVVDGETVGRVLSFRDVTERVRAEERFVREISQRGATEEALLMQARVLESIKECVIVTDGRGIIRYANPALEGTFGYERAELLGKHSSVLDARSVEEGARAAQRIAAAVQEKGWWEGECPNRRKDGSTFTTENSVTALTVGDERFYVCVQEDVTERRAIQSRLVVSDRMASVGTLAAGVAHEINNPLAYVLANLEMMSEQLAEAAGSLPPGIVRELGAMVAEARQGADRVRKIVRDLKAFSRADEETPIVLDVRQAIEKAISLSFNEIRHRARLVKELRDAPLVLADEARLCQVFVILLVNAAQAFDEGHADRNEIRVRSATDDRGRAVVSVEDTGSGMTPETLNRIFDPFFTTKPVGQGTGLGLSICHGIVTKLGGEISASSAPGKGTSFHVVLPAAPVAPDTAAASPSTVAHGARGRILVIEDDPTVGAAVTRILKDHEVTVVTSGPLALDLLARGARYDVVLCDLMMPEMTGMEVHAELERAYPDVLERVVFMTGGAFTPASKAFLDRVPNEVVEKPFDTRNMRAIVQRFLRK